MNQDPTKAQIPAARSDRHNRLHRQTGVTLQQGKVIKWNNLQNCDVYDHVVPRGCLFAVLVVRTKFIFTSFLF